MKLGISTMIYEKTGIPITESIRRISTLGVTYVDIAVTGTADPRILKEQEVVSLSELLKQQKVIVSGLVLLEARNIATANKGYQQSQMEYCQQSITFGSKLGAQHVLVCWGCGSVEMGLSRNQSWLNSQNFLEELAKWSAEHYPTMKILLEFDPAVFFILNSTTAIEEMLSALNLTNVFANIDIAHMNVTREVPKALGKLKDRMLHVHISDNDGSDDAHIALGRGNINISPYLLELEALGITETCRNHGIDYVVTLELGEKKEPDPDKAVKDSLTYLSALNLFIEQGV